MCVCNGLNFDQFVSTCVFSAGVAGCCAKTTIAPLDRIKILLQAQNPHYKHLGKYEQQIENGTHVPHERDDSLLIFRRVCHSQSCAAEGRLPWLVQGQRGNDGQDLSLRSHPVHGF